MGVQASVILNEGDEYSGRIQEFTVDEGDKAADGEEGEVEWVGDAVDVTLQSGAVAPQFSGVGGFAHGAQHGIYGGIPHAPAQPFGQRVLTPIYAVTSTNPAVLAPTYAATSTPLVGPEPSYVAMEAHPAGLVTVYLAIDEVQCVRSVGNGSL